MSSYHVNRNDVNSYPIAKAIMVADVLPCPSAPDAGASTSTKKTKKKNSKNRASTTTAKKWTSKDTARFSESMKGQGYTEGLIQSIIRSNEAFPVRFWVVDNSGSMTTFDGHKIHQLPGNQIKLLNCSRWAEIQDTVAYHARMAALLEAPTSFRLLNPVYNIEQFGIAERGSENIPEDLRIALSNIRDVSPSGVTPLSDRVQEIGIYIESMKDQLTAKGQKAVVVLATDGLPSDQYGQSSTWQLNEFKLALRSLERLPVWLVIRLCTDDDTVVDYYNNIDNELELSIDILDDFVAEAKEVYEHNKWLNYALPLHRMREMGFYHRLFDLIDERPLNRGELVDFFYLMYGADAMDGVPDPQLDWGRFLDRIAAVTKKENLQWNPIKQRMMPWIDIRKLDQQFGSGFKCSFFW